MYRVIRKQLDALSKQCKSNDLYYYLAHASRSGWKIIIIEVTPILGYIRFQDIAVQTLATLDFILQKG